MILNNGDKIWVTVESRTHGAFFVMIDGALVNPENGVKRSVESLNAVRSALVIEKVTR